MRPPAFWHTGGPAASWLSPLSALWTGAGRLARTLSRPYRPPVPLICVGNAVAGGAGKTPVALALMAGLKRLGRRGGFLSRGHGGSLAGPVLVDPEIHGSAEVGDEPLLLARAAPTVIARDRAAGARHLQSLGVDVIVMDDGLQNRTVAPSAAVLVADGRYGFGNGRVMPAGPLREPLDDALGRVDAVVVVGDDDAGVGARVGGRRPVLHARLEPLPGSERLAARKVLAFAGIGRPAKFADTLRELGADLVELTAFPDHHRYTEDEVMTLIDRAAAKDALPVTTEKDSVRLPPDARRMVETLPVALVWQDPGPIDAWLRQAVGEPGDGDVREAGRETRRRG